ncbi:GNAT family N-acetyltransferase [Chamaesiphon sp. OTE_20_metabat_361]|uniref:GNAT family N-acetyltransferase n=1 Tax=Chamaesiphon sp. OTE_20_metabat_361 TaxID=2964689 RepID=UPI00286A6A69|nr:GNAT family N-acetyltransferase [Chamaesiphon sp. OTE_20_metabat_361]
MGITPSPLQPPVPLTANHLVTDFDCGVDSLNEWLSKRAWKNHTIDVSRTFVVTDGEIVVGYYCLSSAAIDRIEMPKARQRNMPDPIPAALIGRLAVDLRYQGQKIGVSLLQDAICRIVIAAKSVGMAYILVHALDDGAKHFYEINGFVAIPERPLTLFLPVATAVAAIQSQEL